MGAVSLNLTPAAHAIFVQWPTHDRINGRSAQVSRCILFSSVWEEEIQRLKKEVALLKKDKEEMWKQLQERKE